MLKKCLSLLRNLIISIVQTLVAKGSGEVDWDEFLRNCTSGNEAVPVVRVFLRHQ